jgi:ketosteroid isomerase-like protein
MLGRKTGFVSLLGAAALAAIALAPASLAASTGGAATDEVWAAVERGIAQFVNMDRAGFAASIAEEVVAYDIDLEGKPVKMSSMVEALAYFDAIVAEVGKMGAKLRVDLRSHTCAGSADLGWCAVEFDFVATMADGTATTQPSFVSCVLRKTADGWKWVHWHTSLSVLPAPAAP